MSDELTWPDIVPQLHGTASLATVTPGGRPHVAIVTPAVVDDVLWINSFRSARKAANLAANPSVALVWSTEAEVYVWGDAELVDDLDTKRSMWEGTWAYDPATFFGTPGERGLRADPGHPATGHDDGLHRSGTAPAPVASMTDPQCRSDGSKFSQ